MQIDGHTKMAAVIAQPIKHSLSPFIHNLAFSLTDVNAVYLAWEVGPEDLEESIKNIRRYAMLGANLSMPYKQAVLPYLDQISPVASMIGAVNTIQNKDGRLIGHNTDGAGFFASLGDFNPKDKVIAVIGSGGAARSIICQAIFDGAKTIFILDKPAYLQSSQEFFQFLLEGRKTSLKVISREDPEAVQEILNQSDLLVQATSVGMDGSSMPLDASLILPQGIMLADIIYQPLETPFLAWAKDQGIRGTNGLGMLLHQAAAAYRLWTQKEMPVEEIESRLIVKLREKE